MRFDFTDKASYRAWRQQWRTEYAELSQQIRVLRRRRKMYLRRYEHSTVLYNAQLYRVRRLTEKTPNPMFGSLHNIDDLRFQARFQMERLAAAKALSWQLRNAARTTVAA